jgi:hypothetical protein
VSVDHWRARLRAVCTIFEQAVDRVVAYYECTRAEAMEYIAFDILDMYPIEEAEEAR